MILTLFLFKIAALLGKLLGRGSSLPGAIALKLDKHILKKIKLPDTVVAVTGSNGKTSTVELLRTAAKATGKRVISNAEGSNQIQGVTTALLRGCNLRGEVQADIVVLECDERFCQYIFRSFTPSHIVLTNLFRDQMTRNGNSAFVAGELAKGLPEASVLVMNADDPVSAALGYARDNALWFSVEAATLREPEDVAHACDDGAFCPVCHARMQYAWHLQNHLGDYACPNCGFARKTPTHTITAVHDNAFILDSDVSIKPQLCNFFYAYNIVAAYTVAVSVFGLSPGETADALAGHEMSNALVDRVSTFQIGEHPGQFLLSKHENLMCYNGALRTMLDGTEDALTVVLIVDLLSRKYIANDMSWLWDIDFELLTDARVQRVIVGGNYAYDVAARLLFANVACERVFPFSNLDAMMDDLYDHAVGSVYLLTCFTDIGKFQKRLRKGAGQ